MSLAEATVSRGQLAADDRDYTQYQWLGQPRGVPMRTDVYVYISGPMTAKLDGPSIEQNLADGVDLFLTLLKAGVPAHCPHLNGYPPSCWTALPHEAWIALDRVVIDRCTHVLMMDRWQQSTGASMEHAYAREKGIPIAYSVTQLYAQIQLGAVP